MTWLGDYAEDFAALTFTFSTRKDTGLPTVLTGSPVITVYKGGSITGKTSAEAYITLTIDFNSKVGLNHVLIDLSGDAFFAIGNDYHVVITTGTVNSISVIGETVATFSIENRFDEVDVTKIGGGAVPTPAVTGVPDVNVTHQGDGAIPAPAVTGVPDVNLTHHVDVAASVSNGELDVNMGQMLGSATGITRMNLHYGADSAYAPKYSGPRGPGVYLNDAAANTNTTNGTDGTFQVPVSTIAAAKTLADSMGFDRIYLVNDSSITLAAAMVDYEFVGIGEIASNVVNLGSQDVSNSFFCNLSIQGTQGGSSRISACGCALADPGAGATTLHICAHSCGIVDEIEVDTSADNVFDQCFSLVSGTAAPIIIATGASGTISVRHFSGGIEFKSLSASHNVSLETDGQVIFNADCNVNATVVLRGNMTITDNTAGMNSLTTDAVYDRRSDIIATLADTNELQGDWANDGRLDVLLDAIKTITDALPNSGALTDIATNAARLTAVRAAVLTDWIDAGRLDLILDEILVDTGTSIPSVNSSMATEVSAILVDTAVIGAAGAGLTDLGGMSTSMKGEINTQVDGAFTTQMADSVALDGTIATREQAMYMSLQRHTEFSISGTTLTVKKVDGSTTLYTLTLDDATNPTSVTRS